jgi:hypothetical protein
MLKLSLKNLKLFDIINKESNTFIRTPEPSEAGELDSMYLLADWLYWASLNNLVSQERYINLSTYLNTIPSVGEYFKMLSNQ